MMKRAKGDGIEVVKIFQESQSALKIGRPVFAEMMEYIQSGRADGILCWKLDRLSRNPVDAAHIQWLLQEEVIKKIITIDSIHLPTDNAVIFALQSSMANQYSRDISVNVKRGNRAKLEKGLWPGRAPMGYKNDQAAKETVIDEEVAPHLVFAFREYAKGGLSVSELATKLEERGFTSYSGGRVATSSLHNWLTNPFYYGLMRRSEGDFPGKHLPLIDYETWQRVQDVISGKTKSRRQKHFFPFRDFLTCDVCRCNYTADTKKEGRYTYYYCTNGKKSCTAHRKYLSDAHVEKELSGIFDDISFDKELVEIMYEAAKEKEKSENKIEVKETLKRRLTDLEKKEDVLTDKYIEEKISEKVYKRKISDIEAERAQIGTQLNQKNDERQLTFEQTKNVFLSPYRAKKQFLSQDGVQKRKALENVLSNARIKDGKIAYLRYKQPFQMMAEVPKNADLPTVLRWRDSNPRYTGPEPDALPLGHTSLILFQIDFIFLAAQTLNRFFVFTGTHTTYLHLKT